MTCENYTRFKFPCLVSVKHSQVPLFVYRGQCFCTTNTEWSTCDADCMANNVNFLTLMLFA